jgi:hypothetical protein
MVTPGGLVQGSLLLEVAAARIDEIGPGIEQPTQLVRSPVHGRVQDGVDGLPLIGRVGLAAFEVAGEQLDRLDPLLLGDPVNGAPVIVRCAGLEAASKARRTVSTSPSRAAAKIRLRSKRPPLIVSTCALS